MKRQNACVYCGSLRKLTVDHVIPVSRWREVGINRRILNNKSNLVIACRKCNEEKANLLLQEWFFRHPDYEKRFRQSV